MGWSAVLTGRPLMFLGQPLISEFLSSHFFQRPCRNLVESYLLWDKSVANAFFFFPDCQHFIGLGVVLKRLF